MVYPSRVDPMTAAGLPRSVKGSVVLDPWKWVEDLNRAARAGKPAGLLFDEVNGGDAQQLAAVQSAVAERRVGDARLDPGVSIMAAANPVSISTGGIELPPPIISRFLHVRWFEEGPYLPAPPSPFILSRRDWLAWMRGQGGGHGLLAMAIEAIGLPAAGEPEGEKMFPCPRAWEHLARLIPLFDRGDPDLEGLALGSVGSVGVKAIMWLRDLKLPGAEELLQGADIPSVPDRAAACIEVVRSFIERQRGDIDDNLRRQAVILIGRMLDKHPGLGVVLASRIGKLILSPGWTPSPEEESILLRLKAMS